MGLIYEIYNTSGKALDKLIQEKLGISRAVGETDDRFRRRVSDLKSRQQDGGVPEDGEEC